MNEPRRRPRAAAAATWRPLASGPLARRARDLAFSIGDELRTIELDNTGLYVGHAGLVVFYDYLDRIDRAGAWRTALAHHRARAMRDAGVGDPFSLHFGGLGVAWLLHYLHEPNDPCAPLDAALVHFLETADMTRAPAHITAGLAGIGLYALERNFSDRHLRLVVRALARAARSTSDGTTWKLRLVGMKHYNLGPLTGVPGVIAVLAAIGARLGWPRATRTLFTSSLRWLLAQRSSSPRDPPFPPWVRPRPRHRHIEPSYHYGEVGMAGVFTAANAASPTLARLADDLTQLATARARDVSVLDPGDLTLCHGSAGVAHVFNRLAHRTPDRAHRGIATSWLAGTCDVIEARGPWTTWCKRPGFVDGAAGVALVLAAATSTEEPTWDRLLLLSHPPPSRPRLDRMRARQ